MLFSEVYGTYFNVLAKILEQAVEGELTRKQMYAIIQEHGFEESILTIPQNLQDETWPLLLEDMTTPLNHVPSMPLTLLQKRWMKSLLEDPRIRLFDPPTQGLEDVQPLYPGDAFVYFDQYLDGDPWENPGYIANFRKILAALREKRRLKVEFVGGKGNKRCTECVPWRLEYSLKDDKFRLFATEDRGTVTINLGRVTGCQLLEPYQPDAYTAPAALPRQKLVLEVKDYRNALERCMLHFSHLEKQTERIEERLYRLTLYYDREDEAEMLIRVLSFGPLVRVMEPAGFRDQLIKRIRRQLERKNTQTE